MARLSGKLTARALGWTRNMIGIRTEKMSDTARLPLGRVVGIVSGLHDTLNEETGQIMTGLKGQFRGVSTLFVQTEKKNNKGEVVKDKDGNVELIDTDEKIVVTAGRCYLPSGLQDMIEGSYREAIKDDPKATVSFAIDLFAMKAKNKAGYTFDGDTLVEAAADDPLAALLEAADEMKALPAPKAEEPAAA